MLEPRRHEHTRLSLALQLCTVRFLGTFLSDPTDVPHNVILTLASQLNIADPTVLAHYREGLMRLDYVHEIMQEYSYHDFSSQPEHFRFLRWLYTRACLMFGLFWCLGYQFSPRLAEMKETRFWRIDPTADYGPLNGLARHQINTHLIANNWDDILRVAGSLKVGTVHASTPVQALQRGGRPTTLARAIAELGRIAKSLYLLNYIDDEHYSLRIQIQRMWNA